MTVTLRQPEPANEASVHSLGGATTNPCTLCAPLGAVLVCAGIEGAMPLLHGAQGCATYIRRYLISHFREPVDVASSSFGESQTVFGGESNLNKALDNITQQYQPSLVTVATTCVAETVGEDVAMMVKRYLSNGERHLTIVSTSTPSYRDGHVEGFHAMVHSIVRSLAIRTGSTLCRLNVFPGLVSPADLRHLRELVSGFGLGATVLPDYSETLDGAITDQYESRAPGGTPLEDIRDMAKALGTIDFTMTGKASRASDVLRDRGNPVHVIGLPIGVRATDQLIDILAQYSQSATPDWLVQERGRLLDAYADGHKYVFGKRIAVYGEPEWVVALTRFLLEIGAKPVVCATGARNRALSAALACLDNPAIEEVLDDTDFARIRDACQRNHVELLLGNSKGYPVARTLGVPLLRVGFPIHDRIGAARLLLVGYRGTLALFDALVNTLLACKQDSSDVGFAYL